METDRAYLHDVVKSTLQFNEALARESLHGVNAVPDSFDSLRLSQCKIVITERREVMIAHYDRAKMDLTAATKDSPLFRLDETTRKIIYAYALTYRDPISVRKHCATTSRYDGESARLMRESWRFTPGLLRTCRRIQQEAAPVFFSKNTFKGTIRNSDVSEITGWIEDTDTDYLRHVREFIIVIEPTSFMDILDMSTAGYGFEICKQARVLANSLAKTGAGSPKIDLPALKHLAREAKTTKFEVEDAEQVRSRWVLEPASAFKKVDGDGDACLVKRMRALMGKVKKGGSKGHGKSSST